jgi:hypothetical protein
MPSAIHLMLRSAQRACPRLGLGARLEARTTAIQQKIIPTRFSGMVEEQAEEGVIDLG